MALTARRDGSESEEPASSRVESFLEGIESTRRQTSIVRIVAAVVAGIVATVAYLTSRGTIPPDAARLAVSAGTLVAGFLATTPASVEP